MRLSRIPAATKTANPVRRAGFRSGSGAGSGSGEGWRSIESTRDGGEAARLVCHVRGTGPPPCAQRRTPRSDRAVAPGRSGGSNPELERHAARDLDDPSRSRRRRRAAEERVTQVVDRILEVHGVEEVERLDPKLQVRAADLESLDQRKVHVEVARPVEGVPSQRAVLAETGNREVGGL